MSVCFCQNYMSSVYCYWLKYQALRCDFHDFNLAKYSSPYSQDLRMN